MIFIYLLCGWKLNRKVNNYYKKRSCIIFIYSILEMYFTTNLHPILVTWEQISMDYSSVSKSYYGSKLHLITSVRGIFQSMDLTKTGIHDVHLSTGLMVWKVKIKPGSFSTSVKEKMKYENSSIIPAYPFDWVLFAKVFLRLLESGEFRVRRN